MLCLSRTIGEQIEINCGDTTIVVTVVEIRGNKTRLGITAPPEVRIHRKEVADAIRTDGEIQKPAKPPIVPVVRIGDALPGQ
jgi:carbon storage regulator